MMTIVVFLCCFDTVGSVTGRPSNPHEGCAAYLHLVPGSIIPNPTTFDACRSMRLVDPVRLYGKVNKWSDRQTTVLGW